MSASNIKESNLKLVSWNINRQKRAWDVLANSQYDIALLQEAVPPPRHLLDRIEVNPGVWTTAGTKTRNWRTAIVRLTENVRVEWINSKPLAEATQGEIPTSRMGTLAGARLYCDQANSLTIFSCYAAWEPHHKGSTQLSDASVHRLISDISGFLGRGEKVLLAGDFNIMNRYGEHGSKHWGERYASAFDRLMALGLEFLGPQFPNGRKALPHPAELPVDSLDVPTYYPRQRDPAGATRQIDFVFGTSNIAGRVRTKALNEIDKWGMSDHCQVSIDFSEA
ncbi:endonuclease/exonuclease/phosphatase family protein [Haliea sp. E17]|uniref:endonuclease/exonuclease/phosphatase family protein n=1 Tax=Haliea sp. E17 TaxID=3401576 RepID=UPI003AAEDB78